MRTALPRAVAAAQIPSPPGPAARPAAQRVTGRSPPPPARARRRRARRRQGRLPFTGPPAGSPLDHDAFDLVERDRLRRPVVQLRRLRPPRTAPRSGPPRPRRPPAAPRDAPLEGIDRHRDPGQPRGPSGAHRPWGLHACHPARRRVWKDPAMVVRYAASVSTREGAVSRYVPALFRPMRPGHKGEDPSPVPE